MKGREDLACSRRLEDQEDKELEANSGGGGGEPNACRASEPIKSQIRQEEAINEVDDFTSLQIIVTRTGFCFVSWLIA